MTPYHIKTLKLAKLAATVPLYPLLPSKRYASWLRREVEKAGCLYVKIGQWVSSRTDIFPEVITEEFSSLKNASEPMAEHHVTHAIAGLEFDAFDSEPVSTGSIAQVHRGVYNGQDVAVKIKRPGLLDQLVEDVSAVRWVLGFFKGANPKMHDDLVQSLDDLVDTVQRELDFPEESRHMDRFRAFFPESAVKIPRVVHATSNVIVMEFVDASDFTGKAEKLMEMFFVQFFELGWLHTDMHSGNIGQLADGTPVLFDFGSVMEIPDDIRLCIKSLMISYMNRNVSVMLDYMLEYGMLTGSPCAEERRMLELFLENVLGYVEVTDMNKFTEVMKTIPVYQTPTTTFRPEIFLIMRSFTLMEGLCKSLDPEFVILDAVSPLTETFARDPYVIRLKVEDDIRNFVHSLNPDP